MNLKAKRHSFLDTLKKDLARGMIEKEATVGGHKYRMHTLNEEEETWVDAHVSADTTLAFVSGRMAPRVAAAVTHIDGMAVGEMFSYPDDMPEDARKSLDNNPLDKKLWVRAQLLLFFAEESNRDFIRQLNDAYLEMQKAIREEVKDTVNL